MARRQTIDEVMTPNPVTLSASASVREAARAMRESDCGAVIVEKGGQLTGILTDRDIVVRCLADGGNCDKVEIGTICSSDVKTLSPEDDVDAAVALMRDKAVRRVPVMSNGHAVGVVSLGDLAMLRDPQSALGNISGAEPNL